MSVCLINQKTTISDTMVYGSFVFWIQIQAFKALFYNSKNFYKAF